MSDTDIEDVLSYFTKSGNQINMGWTLTNWWFVILFFIGLFLMFLAFLFIVINRDMVHGLSSKKSLVVLGFFGLGIVIVGALGTMYSFGVAVKRINRNIKELGPCSLFQNVNASNAIEKAVSANTLQFAANSRINSAVDAYNGKTILVNNGAIEKNRFDDSSKSYIGVGNSSPNGGFPSIETASPIFNLGQQQQLQLLQQAARPSVALNNDSANARRVSQLIQQFDPSGDNAESASQQLLKQIQSLNTGYQQTLLEPFLQKLLSSQRADIRNFGNLIQNELSS